MYNFSQSARTHYRSGNVGSMGQETPSFNNKIRLQTI